MLQSLNFKVCRLIFSISIRSYESLFCKEAKKILQREKHAGILRFYPRKCLYVLKLSVNMKVKQCLLRWIIIVNSECEHRAIWGMTAWTHGCIFKVLLKRSLDIALFCLGYFADKIVGKCMRANLPKKFPVDLQRFMSRVRFCNSWLRRDLILHQLAIWRLIQECQECFYKLTLQVMFELI